MLDPAEPEVAAAIDDARATFRRMGALPRRGLLARTAARQPSATATPARRRASADAPISNA